MAFDGKELRRRLEAAAAAADTDTKGKAYERLVAYVFDDVPGILIEPDLTTPLKAEQIDLAIGNLRRDDGLPLLPNVFLVECKFWDRSVDAKAVGYFINTLANRRCEMGVLVAADGVTGELNDMTFAHSLGLPAVARGIIVLVVTNKDLLTLTSTSDFVELLHRRYLRAVATGGLGAPAAQLL